MIIVVYPWWLFLKHASNLSECLNFGIDYICTFFHFWWLCDKLSLASGNNFMHASHAEEKKTGKYVTYSLVVIKPVISQTLGSQVLYPSSCRETLVSKAIYFVRIDRLLAFRKKNLSRSGKSHREFVWSQAKLRSWKKSGKIEII